MNSLARAGATRHLIRSSRALRRIVAVLVAVACALPLGAQSWRGGSDVEIRVLSRKKKPLAGARVQLTYREDGHSESPAPLFADAKGRVVFYDLAAGAWHLEASHPGNLSFVAVLHVPAGGKPEITASFLQATGDGIEPTRVVVQRAKGGQRLTFREAPRRPEPEPAPVQVAEAAPAPAATPTAAPPAVEPSPVEAPSIGNGAADEVPVAAAPVEEAPIRELEASEPPPVVEAPPIEAPAVETPPVEAPDPIEPAQIEPAQAPPPPVASPEPPMPEPAVPEPTVPESTVPENTLPEPTVSERTVPEPAATEAPPVPDSPPTPAAAPPAIDPASVVAAPERMGRSILRDPESAEWAAASERVVPPGGAAPCPTGLEDAVRRAMWLVASSPRLELASFAGAVDDDSGNAAIDRLSSARRQRVEELLAPYEEAASCAPIAVVLPKGAQFIASHLVAADASGTGECEPEFDCPIGQGGWVSVPSVGRGPSATVVYGIFRNAHESHARRIRLTARFIAPSQAWEPPAATEP